MIEGVEATTGPLGQGIAMSVGASPRAPAPIPVDVGVVAALGIEIGVALAKCISPSTR